MAAARDKGFKPELGLFAVVTLIMGSMIGSGIFRMPAEMAALTGSAWLVIAAWIIAGVIALCGSLTFAELSAAFPRAGGQYVFLQESMGRSVSFLYGWTMFWVIQTGIIAAVAAVFASFAGFFFDLPGMEVRVWIFTLPRWGETFLAIGVIWFLTAVNYFGVKQGALIQNVSTVMKAGALLFIVGAVFLLGEPRGSYDDFGGQVGSFGLGAFGLALIASLFAYDGWPQATYVMGEVKDPKRNVPRALLIGVGSVALVYVLATAAYFFVLDIDQASGNALIASDAAEVVMGGGGATFVAVAVLVSTFGTINGYVLTSPRIFYAMARDKNFPRAFGRLSGRRTPLFGLWYQAIWASLLTLTGTYLEIVLAVVMGIWLFHIPTAIGYFKLKAGRPGLFASYRMPLSPVPAFVYIASAIVVTATFILQAIFGNAQSLRTVVILAAILLAGVPLMWAGRASVDRTDLEGDPAEDEATPPPAPGKGRARRPGKRPSTPAA